MAEKIEANYEQLGMIARNFTQESDVIDQMLKEVESRLGDLEGGGWIGRGAQACYAEMHDEVLPAVQRLREALEEAARTTGELARIFREAEETASSRFRVA